MAARLLGLFVAEVDVEDQAATLGVTKAPVYTARVSDEGEASD